GIRDCHVTRVQTCALPIYVLPLYSTEDKEVKALLYALDTHNNPATPLHGHYNWIQFDQIKWYREISDYYTSLNEGNPVPALAFRSEEHTSELQSRENLVCR